MEPSLFTLFRRGRFVRRIAASDSESDGAIKEAERFAVAAIAFVAQHDADFRHALVQALLPAGYSTVSEEGLKISADRYRWADLLIRAPSRFVIVAEFKINAALQPHQDFSADQFFDASSGYGHQIVTSYPDEDCRVYTVVGAKRQLIPKSSPGLACHAVGWNRLVTGQGRSKLVDDLYDCLGKLGVQTFAHMKTDDLQIDAAGMKGAAQTYSVLHDAAEHLEIPSSRSRVDCSFSSTGWYFGLAIQIDDERRKAGNLRKLQQAVGRGTGDVAWFGFEESDPKGRTAVWFYTEAANQEPLAGKLQLKLSSSVAAIQLRNDGDDHFVQVIAAASLPAGPKQWFIEVLSAAAE